MTHLLLQLGIILLGLFLAGRLAYQIRFSIVPLYILAGILLANYVSHSELVDFLSILGVIFLLFYMGLDFSLTAFLRQWRSILTAGSIDLFINFGIGFALGQLLGWNLIEALFLAGILYMTSSAVVAKSLIDLKRVANPETETILGIMVFEDLVIALYLAVLSGIALSGRMEAGPVSLAVVKGIGFCAVFVLLARWARPWIERLLSQDSTELFLLLVFSLVLLSGYAAIALGLSEAIGAFMVGLLVAETTQKDRVHELFLPFQQFFAALFFVSFGMKIDYKTFPVILASGLLLTGVALIGKIVAGFLAGRWQGFSNVASFNIGFSMVAKGEFSIILAGVAANVARPEIHIQALIAFVVLLMSIIGPTLMKESYAIIAFIDRIQTQVRRRGKPASTVEPQR